VRAEDRGWLAALTPIARCHIVLALQLWEQQRARGRKRTTTSAAITRSIRDRRERRRAKRGRMVALALSTCAAGVAAGLQHTRTLLLRQLGTAGSTTFQSDQVHQGAELVTGVTVDTDPTTWGRARHSRCRRLETDHQAISSSCTPGGPVKNS